MAVNSSMISYFDQTQIQGFQYICIRNWNISITINQMNGMQISWFSDGQCFNFTSNVVVQILPGVLKYFTINQIAQFSADVVSKFTVPQLEQLYMTYNSSLLYNIIPLSKFYLTPYYNIMQFKALMNSTLMPVLYQNDSLLNNNQTAVSWIIVTSLMDSDSNIYFTKNNFTTIQNIPSMAIGGLRPGQTTNLIPQVFALITSSQAAYLYPDVLSNMTIGQYQKLTPAAIAGINSTFMAYIPIDVYSQLTCLQIEAITVDQANNMNNTDRYNTKVVMCTFGIFMESSLLIGFGIAFGSTILITLVAILILKKREKGYVKLQ
jgi:hypothetical protein